MAGPRVYSRKHFVLTKGCHNPCGLTIRLGVKSPYEAVLPAVIVGPDCGPKDTIFYLNVHPTNDAKLMRAGAESLAELILANKTCSAVITPQSHKSIPCMAEAVRIASDKGGRHIEFIVLLGGKDKKSVRKGCSAHRTHYCPITTPEGKWTSITDDDIARLCRAAPSADQVMIIDDVYSRGGTLRGVFTLINGVYGRSDDMIFPSALIAVEQSINALDPMAIPSHIRTSIIIPEIPGTPSEH